MAHKDKFSVGDRVKFLRSHDKTVQLEGKVVRVHDNADDCVDIETIPDGRVAEVSTVETAHAADVTFAAVPATPKARSKKSHQGEDPQVSE